MLTSRLISLNDVPSADHSGDHTFGGRDVTRNALRVPSWVVLIGRLAVGANTAAVPPSRSLTSSQANVKPEAVSLLPSVSGNPFHEVTA